MTTLRALATPLFLLFCWHLLSSGGFFPRYLLPSPAVVWETTVQLWQSGVLPTNIRASLSRIAVGFSLSCLAAFCIAALVTRFSFLKNLLAAPLGLLRMIPPLAMIPLLILWLGIGRATQVTIIVLASFFPIFMNTCEGLARISPEHRELARSLRLPTRIFIRCIVIPSATPSIITGLRLAFGYSWRALIGAELIAASSGLGHMIIDAQQMLRTDEALSGILTIGLIGWSLDALFIRGSARLLRRRFPELAV